MLKTEFYTKRNQAIIERFKKLKTEKPNSKRPELLKLISEETKKKGDPLSTFTIDRIISDASYMPHTKKQSA